MGYTQGDIQISWGVKPNRPTERRTEHPQAIIEVLNTKQEFSNHGSSIGNGGKLSKAGAQLCYVSLEKLQIQAALQIKLWDLNKKV